MGTAYEPSGKVKKVDVFYCTPLHAVCMDKETWVKEQLAQWGDFSREPIEFIDCEGEHADVINGPYAEGFEQRLSKVLAARGI
jgi:thioesterase domain-containing protein